MQYSKLLLLLTVFACGSKKQVPVQTGESVVAEPSKPTQKYQPSTIIADSKNIDIVTDNQMDATDDTIEPYVITNKRHKFLIDSFANELRKYPLRDSTDNIFVGTINFNFRKPNYVVIHHTAQNTCEQTLHTFTVTHSAVSAHYVICRTGTVYHMLSDNMRAWHGGKSRWGTMTDLNSSSIGIELDNNGAEPFSNAQIDALLKLLQELKNAYDIPKSNFIGHSDIAPTRKNDPSKYFPWRNLSENGFGNWYDTTKVKVPNGFNYKDGLRLIGYDIRNERMAIKAFKLHYYNTDTSAVIDKHALKMIYSLSQQYQ